MRAMDIVVRDQVINRLSKHFHDNMKMKQRIKVMADVDKFDTKESEHAWNQKKGITPNFYSVYLDDEFVCSFLETDSRELFEYAFFTRLHELIDEDKIDLYEPKKHEPTIDELAVQIKEAKKKSAPSPEDKVAKQAVVEILEEKKVKRDKAKQKIQSAY